MESGSLPVASKLCGQSSMRHVGTKHQFEVVTCDQRREKNGGIDAAMLDQTSASVTNSSAVRREKVGGCR